MKAGCATAIVLDKWNFAESHPEVQDARRRSHTSAREWRRSCGCARAC